MPPRPAAIPGGFEVRLSSKPGIKYIQPGNTHESIRVMPGIPDSPNPFQQKPYVIHMRDGNALDKFGNIVNKRSPEAHIPVDEFVYRNK